jgi:hypothetical protein
MNDEQYRTYGLTLMDRFAGFLEKEAANTSSEDPLRELAEGFRGHARGEGLHEQGPLLVQRLFGSCPQLAPAFPRDLLWFLGGDCLHFLADDEIDGYQQLDEKRLDTASRGELMNYPEERAKLLKLL